MFLTYILARLRAWRRYNATVSELSNLSDAQLKDVGLNRYDIPSTARGLLQV